MSGTPDILCIGSCLWDIIGRAPTPMRLGSDVPGRITRVPGGVAMNIAIALRHMGLSPAILTAVGRDAEGDDLLAEAGRMGIVTDFAHRSEDLPTDRYVAIEGAGDLVAAIADAHSLEAADDKILRPLADGRLGSEAAPWPGPVALDGNLTADLLARAATSPLLARADLRVAPASPGKAGRLRSLLAHPQVTLYVNLEEAGLLCQAEFTSSSTAAAGLLARGVRRALVTDGGRAASLGDGAGVLTTAPPEVAVTRVTGAGDTFMAAHIVAELQGLPRDGALDLALRVAALYVAGEVPS